MMECILTYSRLSSLYLVRCHCRPMGRTPRVIDLSVIFLQKDSGLRRELPSGLSYSSPSLRVEDLRVEDSRTTSQNNIFGRIRYTLTRSTFFLLRNYIWQQETLSNKLHFCCEKLLSPLIANPLSKEAFEDHPQHDN